MPTEMPLTSANTSTSSTAISWKAGGWPNHATPAATVAVPHSSAHAATQAMPGPRRACASRAARLRHWRHACASSSATSSAAAPMIMPSATRKVALRYGSPGASHPTDTNHGVSAQPARPPTSAAIPMRAPTIMPAPKVAADRSSAASHGTRAAPRPLASPSAAPPPSRATERRSSTGSVSARRILATASPDGNVSCIRSTSNGVYSMPMPTPYMPMHSM
ncbi:hypothetical protein FQZ97_615400 [compost metagenome]